jgi:hydrogenase nickel incorporation protein HypB
MAVQRIEVVKNILEGNEVLAERNRALFSSAGVLAINVMASPGAGKTSLIVKAIERLRGQVRIGVIEGDIAGSIDTEKVLAAGASSAVQINTGGSCHLEANMVQTALGRLDLNLVDILFVENVGNLVCPTHWALGEQVKLCLLSTPEGHDKPVKYPEIFAVSDIIVLNKIDLIDLVDFEREFFYEAVRALNPHAPILEISCRSGEGIEKWTEWLVARALLARALVSRAAASSAPAGEPHQAKLSIPISAQPVTIPTISPK